MFKFITHRHFIVNLLVAIVLVIVLMFIFLWSLGFITDHGKYIKTPSVKGKPVAEARKMLENQGFKIEVQDSLYVDSLPPMAVIKQSPEADALVKSNRTVYLTINRSQPPLVEVPNMVGFSFRNALMYIKQLGLKLGDTTRKPDIARDAVLEQLYNGQQIKPGIKIQMGSTISFVLGSGLGDKEFKVPVVTGMTYAKAKEALKSMSLNVGALVIDPDVRDTVSAFVYKQYPDKKTEISEGVFQDNMIRAGQGIDLWLSKKMIQIPKDDKNSKEESKTDKTDKGNEY